MPLPIALEEAIAGGAEALPEDLRMLAVDRTHGLPVGLQLFELRGGLVPLLGVGHRFGLGDERLLALAVALPLVAARAQVFLAAAEERVAGCVEALPEGVRLR